MVEVRRERKRALRRERKMAMNEKGIGWMGEQVRGVKMWFCRRVSSHFAWLGSSFSPLGGHEEAIAVYALSFFQSAECPYSSCPNASLNYSNLMGIYSLYSSSNRPHPTVTIGSLYSPRATASRPFVPTTRAPCAVAATSRPSVGERVERW